MLKLAKEFAKRCPDWHPRVWERGQKIRVYLSYPRGRGGAGGGDMGWVDFSGPRVKWETALVREDALELSAALEDAKKAVQDTDAL